MNTRRQAGLLREAGAVKAVAERLNRPLLASDLGTLDSRPRVAELRKLVRTYRGQGLPLMNGSFTYSNLLEGRGQILTCNPYRLWEYTSVFDVLDRQPMRGTFFVDVGGAGAPLAFFLAENGYRGITIDLQPIAVALADYVARSRGLPLQSRLVDVTTAVDDLAGQVDVVTFISVLEHVPAPARVAIFQAVFRLLKPGGLFYMTFDYGTHVQVDSYDQISPITHESRSISDITALCVDLERVGFRFLEDDPRELPEEVKAAQQAPEHEWVTWRYAVNSEPFDSETPWNEVAKYIVKRAFRVTRARPSRYARHNFFRMFLETP